ncbi:MAG: glycosyltransferase family 4 protein [Flavobacteriaceae bacterium]|nr:glycosyltransferase family 4 protein [Flavobacteriaceae bacterium]
MTSIKIYYTAVANKDGEYISIGGIQNYLISLSKVFMNKGYEVVIYQTANSDFKLVHNQVLIKGFKTNNKHSPKKQVKEVYNRTKNKIQLDDIIIWGTDKVALKIKHQKSIAIQHGVSFDYIVYHDLKFSNLFRTNTFGFIYKILQNRKAAKQFLTCKNIVCVDYNYLNWIRTYLPRKLSENAYTIPNFSKTTNQKNRIHQDLSIIKILFARRFEEIRGVDIMIDIIKQISKKYDHVEFTICGEGSLKTKIINKLKSYQKVTISQFEIGQAEEINLNHHLAIIPSHGSEGTSLSLLEAMAAGAVPIASNVGGLTNIIINGFNGYLVNPNSIDFITTLSKLIETPQNLIEVSQNAKKTVEGGFSFNQWSNSWLEVIKNIEKL